MIFSLVLAQAADTVVTWVHVPKPTYDVVGVVLSSLTLAGICIGVAFSLGFALGVALIVRGRHQAAEGWRPEGLRLSRAEMNSARS